MYKANAPKDIEMVTTIVPVHFPNKIPDNNVIGNPNPNKKTQTIAKIEKIIVLIKKF